MLNSGPSGFQNAPLTKALLLCTGICSLGASVLRTQNHLEFSDISSVVSKFQVWRLITSHMFFTSPGELLFGLLLIYYFRIFERQMGTVKFGSFTFIAITVSTMAQVAMYVVFPSVRFSSGPYSFVFACLVLYFSDIPATYRFRLCGVSTTDKLFTYILSLQLLLSNSPHSVFSGICGILSGLAYKSDTLGLSKWKFPNFINNFCSRFIKPLLVDNKPRTSIQTTPFPIPNVNSNRSPSAFVNAFVQQPSFPSQGYSDQLLPTFPVSSDVVATPMQPSNDSIELLTGMGFPRQAVIEALTRCNNNVEMATHILLDQQ